MGSLVGHVAPGFGFLVIGLWHLYNHIKLHALRPDSYASLPWFPISKAKYLELYTIMLGGSMSISMELFIGPVRHQPFDTDGTIPSNHLHNFEHSEISAMFFVYALFAILLDRMGPRDMRYGLTQLLASLAFGQELLLFHLHSADHMGVEGQYHLLLQIVIAVSLSTTLTGVALPSSFLVSFVRSASILFQGLWLVVMGFMLWTPGFMPKGCFMNSEEGHKVVRCSTDQALHRAKSLVNIEFAWLLIVVSVFAVSLYLVLVKIYSSRVEYQSLSTDIEFGEESHGTESQKTSGIRDKGESLAPFNIGR